ncbi:2-hydroxychromene-2-carboxylate isomerase [Variibacter gotjawalensis]|uniref:2-hydroxychromene-2-carboxylate isomerase n=1 Tax=Variibacter gotjawalensis TaxID=1333996 RepID=A0A0S3PUK6_9BRAD|nr:DsbA family protein [Variibacter gotjawalensis]NIK49912.1 2-hydroxychromene-2-carboxylate isomerase [Variibacter gotjawalensis]RZS45911.1 2-hydroxychromene-2-carboxylate isomerase [Variibacter gotjawalensis]BAT59586.1 2-hydroxychromene-2-carboxylate isomerase [Variibacter gotjawalensis]
MAEREEFRMYSDFKSPYAWLAFEPVFDLEKKYNVRIKWMPFQLRIKGSGQRSVYSEFKVKYSYMDARRSANERGDKKMIRGPLKIYNTEASLIGGLFAEKQGRIVEYGRKVYELFFKRELEIDDADAVANFIASMGMSADDYRAFLAGPGKAEYDAAQEQAMADQIFGVPICVFRGEQFWGNDRVAMLERRLQSAGLALDNKSAA